MRGLDFLQFDPTSMPPTYVRVVRAVTTVGAIVFTVIASVSAAMALAAALVALRCWIA
jgi:uncharacterized membrane protein